MDRYLLLVDISGYTAFLAGVERTHGEDFSGGLPAGYRVLGELLQGVIDGLPPEFELVKVEGDAVFAAAPGDALDGQGARVVRSLGDLYRAFAARRDALALSATDDKCTACFAAARLDLKMVLHSGLAVLQSIGGRKDLAGPAVIIAHRLLKNTVRERLRLGSYLLLTQVAASRLAEPELGRPHDEDYPDIGRMDVRVVDLAEVAGIVATPWPDPPAGAEAWPEIRLSRT